MRLGLFAGLNKATRSPSLQLALSVAPTSSSQLRRLAYCTTTTTNTNTTIHSSSTTPAITTAPALSTAHRRPTSHLRSPDFWKRSVVAQQRVAPLRQILSRCHSAAAAAAAMEHNVAKRKEHPEQYHDRPLKQFRAGGASLAATNGTETSADQSPTNGYLPDAAADGEAKSVVHAATADSAEWQATIESVVSKVVSIHFCQTSAFDTDPALSSEATGFVVDEENGYIMTNRHVVGAGPFWGYVIFENHEECDVHPVYRDPVHDFGILKFDPKAVKYLKLSPLKLRPDLAKLGSEIRVVGNDAGEKLSILSGVISRLDRNAPEYSEGYCDFNTNYIQAAAAASGGSSGSPVVNIDGFAVALQAGGRQDGAATDYFLPLDRPLRALECIKNGLPVTRGTIQVQWLIKPFDECRRLGLTPEREFEVRTKFPKETGMLVAEVVLPRGPADKKIEEGDVLVKVNGELLTQFVRLDDVLDTSVGGKVKLLVQRGGEEFDVTVDVEDLHSITPDRYVSVAGALFHDLSYQQARFYAVTLKDQGAYCCEASGSFRFEGCEFGWLVQSIDNKPTPNLDTFVEVMKTIPDRARVVVTYKHLRDMHTLNTSILLVDRHWHRKITLHTRNDKTGLWDSKVLANPLPPVLPPPRKANFIQMAGAQNKTAVDVVRSFVRVSVSLPLRLDGFPKARKIGFGLVVDADKGLVLVSRAIVPYDMCDISVTIADSIIVDGKVVFMHPLQNYAIIQYDPKLVQAPVKTAKLATESIKQGETTTFFGFNQNLRPVVAKTAVTDITSVAIPPSTTTPRYRAVNLDAITVDTSLSERCGSGVLVADDGTVQALWMTYLGERTSSGRDQQYHLGSATPALHAVVDEVRTGVKPNLRILNLETHIIQMSEARIHGVSQEWIDRVETEDPERHQLFMVRKVDANHTGGLTEGDIILTLNDQLVTRVTNFDVMYRNETLDAVIVRQREEKRLKVSTVPTEEFETKRSVVFCGAVLHRPHHAVRQQISKIHSDVYISARMPGSPAYMYGLAPTNFITHVNGVPTPDLDAFVRETNKIPDNTYFRLKLVTFDNQPWVITMKQNMHYFPTVEFIKDPKEREGWRRVAYENGVPKNDEGDVPDAAEEGGATEVDGAAPVEPVDRL